jgi:hypothetical protein
MYSNPSTTVVPHLVTCHQVHCFKPSTPIHTYNTEDIFKLLISGDQEPMLGTLLKTGSKAPMKNVQYLILSLRRGP